MLTGYNVTKSILQEVDKIILIILITNFVQLGLRPTFQCDSMSCISEDFLWEPTKETIVSSYSIGGLLNPGMTKLLCKRNED